MNDATLTSEADAVAAESRHRTVMTDLIDLIEAMRARDEGIARVAASNTEWMPKAVEMAINLTHRGERLMGEDIRLRLTGAGLPPPSKPQAWGALTRYLSSKNIGLLHATGQYDKPKSVKSHACKKPIYVRV